MEKKNTILLTVIAVATLLVAVVGATFAYFTATTGAGDPNDTATTGTATTVGGVNLVMTADTSSNDIAYPGGYVVAGVNVTATNSDTTNNYTTTYQVNGTITNNTKTQLNWTLYRVTSSIANPVTPDSCQRQEAAQGDGTTRYWYEDCTLDASLTGDTYKVTKGTAAAATTAGTPQETTVTATGETLDVDADSDATVYYYLVVEYPNNASAPQDADQGQTISVILTNVSNGSSVVRGA